LHSSARRFPRFNWHHRSKNLHTWPFCHGSEQSVRELIVTARLVLLWRSLRPRPDPAASRSGGTMTSRIGLLGALLSAFLAGCASVGNESIADATVESVSQQIFKGRTTQAQVRQLFGDPMKTSFTDSGNESWEYNFSRLRSKPTNFIPYVNVVYSGAEGDKKS